MSDEKLKRADEMFERMLSAAREAEGLNTAAGYNVAVNTYKYAASVLNPGKYGTKVTDASGNTQGYLIETGIRRPGDPGFKDGTIPNEKESTGPGVHPQDASVGGQDVLDGLDFNDGPE